MINYKKQQILAGNKEKSVAHHLLMRAGFLSSAERMVPDSVVFESRKNSNQ
jgi:hypothetical protein